MNRQDATSIEPSQALDRLAREVVDSAFAVHTTLGPGLLESVYEQCLAAELAARCLSVDRQVSIPVVYRNQRIDAGFRIDMLVEKTLVIEVKAVERLLPVHEAQLLTYLKLSGHSIGLLVNFNVARIKDGLRRLVLSA